MESEAIDLLIDILKVAKVAICLFGGLMAVITVLLAGVLVNVARKTP